MTSGSTGEVIKPMTSTPRHLRIGTYLCPSLSVELFQLLSEFLEEDLGCETSLMYEWRSTGPLPNRDDPFLSNTLDLGERDFKTFIRVFELQNFKI
jgi:hypothetical protein